MAARQNHEAFVARVKAKFAEERAKGGTPATDVLRRLEQFLAEDEHETEYDRLKAQKDAILAKQATPPQSDPALAAAKSAPGQSAGGSSLGKPSTDSAVDAPQGTGDSPALDYHNPDNLPSPGEAPWRFFTKEEIAEWAQFLKDDKTGRDYTYSRAYIPEAFVEGRWIGHFTGCNPLSSPQLTFRTRRPLPIAPAPAPEGRGETAERPWRVILTTPIFERIECEVVDVGHADRILTVNCQEIDSRLAAHAAAVAQAQALREILYLIDRRDRMNPATCDLKEWNQICIRLGQLRAALAASEAGK